ncbi:hypothetical protein ABZW96_37210 [Nocardia sp. NPDC004168]|uniref:hypothetical protein n=1 Tax=Nocardia sp. NPDC004168 TaxID=3154452 RepID=UPI0033A0A279
MSDKVQDAVEIYNSLSKMGFWEKVSFKDNEDLLALEMIAGLSASEFEQFFSTINPSHRRLLYLDADQNLKEDPRYKDILNAFESGDPQPYIGKKKKEESEPEDDEYTKYGFESLKKEEKHAQYVDLYVPKGSSAQLVSLIEDIEFTMQWCLDTLGLGAPKAAPEFTQVLDDTHAMTIGGWSKIRDAHDDLKNQLKTRQDEYAAAHRDVKGVTYDSAITGSDTFKELGRIMNDLNDRLKFEPHGLTRSGNQLTESSGGPANSEMQVAVYEKNTDENSKDNGKWFLTASAEQRYYVSALDSAAQEWEKVYDGAVKSFQKQAEKVDDAKGQTSTENGSTDSRNNASNNASNSNSDNSKGDSIVPSVQGSAIRWNGDTGENLTSADDSLVDGSTDVSESMTDTDTSTISDDEVPETPYSSSDQLAALHSTPQGAAGTGAGVNSPGSANTGVAPPAVTSGDNGASALQQMAMMSALNGMNQGNHSPSDDRYDRARPEQYRRGEQERERNRSTQENTTNQAMQQAAPASTTAPKYTGAPPPVNTPGGVVDYKVGNSTLQVSQPVAEALQRQTQNTATDAASAYAGTAGESTSDHPWAIVNDVAQLKTGDIVQWEKHSALIVKNETGLNILDNGQLIPLNPNLPPLTAKYGNFTGYAHPTGLDVGSVDRLTATPRPSEVSSTHSVSSPSIVPPQV